MHTNKRTDVENGLIHTNIVFWATEKINRVLFSSLLICFTLTLLED